MTRYLLYAFILGFSLVQVSDLDAQIQINPHQTLLPEDITDHDLFGYDMAMDDDWLVVSSYRRSDSTSTLNQCGGVYVYELVSDEWELHSILYASDQQDFDHFGYAVDIDAGHIIVGAPEQDTDADGLDTLYSAGAVYVFDYQSDGTWLEVQKLVASDRNNLDHFGFSLAIDSDRVVIGSPFKSVLDSDSVELVGAGMIYTFLYSENIEWIETQKISEPDPIQYQNFGYSVDIEDSTMVAIAPYYNFSSTNGGKTYTYHLSINGLWTNMQQIILIVSGESIMLKGDLLFISQFSPGGKLNIFRKGDFNQFSLIQKLKIPEDIEGSYLGHGMDFQDSILVVSDIYGRVDAVDSLATGYYFMAHYSDADTFEIKQSVSLNLSDKREYDYFGFQVAFNGTSIAISAPYKKGLWKDGQELEDAGIVYTYTLDQLTGVEEIFLSEEAISVYPNPASDVLHIEVDSPDRVKVWQIYNLQGTLMDSQTYSNSTIDVSGLATGMYLIQLEYHNTEMRRSKFMKL